MDPQIDPCKDFNKFACGGFSEIMTIPEDKSHWDSSSIIREEIYKQGKKLMEEPINQNEDFESYKKVRAYYKQCMDEKKQKEVGLQPLKEILNIFNGWPVVKGELWNGHDHDIWNISVQLKQEGFSSDYFASSVPFINLSNNSHMLLAFRGASIGLGKVLLSYI